MLAARSRRSGPRPDLGDDPDALDDLADWLTRDNPQFARNMANRVWFHLMGRGVVEPVDDFRDSNPPSQPRAARRPDRRVRRRRAAAPAAGRADHEVADLPARRPARTRRTPTTRPTSPTPRSGSCPPRSCSTRSARSSSKPEPFADAPPAHPGRRRCPGVRTGGHVPQDLRQARPAADLRVRAVRVDHAGPGVPAHQRRGGPLASSRPTTTGSAGCSTPGAADDAILDELYPRRPRPRADAPPSARASSPTSRRPATAGRRGKTSPGRSLNSKEFLLRH